jgi:hypothetical protein
MTEGDKKTKRERVVKACKQCKKKVQEGAGKVKDRRTRTRHRLEEIFSRETFTSIAVIGALGKLVETLVVPSFMSFVPVINTKAAAWLAVLSISVWVSIKWERIAKKAENIEEKAGDVVEG